MENKEKIKERISEFVDRALTAADREGKLDYWDMEINNHQGNLQTKLTVRDRKKVY